MTTQRFFNNDLELKFNAIGDKLYNLKYSFDLFINYLEGEADIPLDAKCLGLILREYFNRIKEDYNNLEEELGVLF